MTLCWPVLVLLLPLAAAAQGPAPEAPPGLLSLRLSREGEGPVWFGQHVRVTATLRTPIRFASAPAFPELSFQVRAIVLPNGTTNPGSERVGGDTYVLLQHVYDVFPVEAGALTVAPMAMAVSVGTLEGGVASTQASSAPLRLEVRLPPGTTDPARLVTAPSLHLSVTQDGDPARVPVGEAITRTVTLLAEDSSAMLLPPMPWAAPEGMRVYPDPPRLNDHSDRGSLSAARTDRAAFVPERPGHYELPGASLQWFEPRSGRMQVLRVPPLTIQAVPAAAAGDVAAGSSRRPLWAVLGVAGGLLLLAMLAWWLGLGSRLADRRRRASDPEAGSFATLRRACHAGDAEGAMAALLRWTVLVLPPGASLTVARLATLTDVPGLETEAAALAQRCYGSGTTAGWDGRALFAAARKARQATRCWTAPASRRNPALPMLNPRTEARPAPRVTLPGWAR